MLLYLPHTQPLPRYQKSFVNSWMTLSCRAFLAGLTDVMSSILVDSSNLYVSTDITYNYMTRWAGMGLKNKGGLGIGCQLNFNHG